MHIGEMEKWLTKKHDNMLKNKGIFYPVDLPLLWAILAASSTGTAQLPGE